MLAIGSEKTVRLNPSVSLFESVGWVTGCNARRRLQAVGERDADTTIQAAFITTRTPDQCSAKTVSPFKSVFFYIPNKQYA